MAYHNVGTPRFYVNIFEYLSAIGYTDIADVYRLNPTQSKANTNVDASRVDYPLGIFTDKSYIAYLGHQGGLLTNSYNFNNAIIINAGLNGTVNNELSPEYEGFSIRSVELSETNFNATYCANPIGSISVGTYYDMPHSPDLSVGLSYENDGVKHIKTPGGASLTDIRYTFAPNWGDSGGAWQLGGFSNLRVGRRVWDLSFSYLSDSDLMPKVASDTNYETGDYEVPNPRVNTLIDGDDFFSMVINRTLGGHLPFIFQVDNLNKNADQFAICKFDMNSFTYEQVANNLYNIKLKIREVW